MKNLFSVCFFFSLKDGELLPLHFEQHDIRWVWLAALRCATAQTSWNWVAWSVFFPAPKVAPTFSGWPPVFWPGLQLHSIFIENAPCVLCLCYIPSKVPRATLPRHQTCISYTQQPYESLVDSQGCCKRHIQGMQVELYILTPNLQWVINLPLFSIYSLK